MIPLETYTECSSNDAIFVKFFNFIIITIGVRFSKNGTTNPPPINLFITANNYPWTSFSLSKHVSDLTKSTKLSQSIRHEEQFKESSEVS